MDLKVRVQIAKKIFGLKRVKISHRKHFKGAVFYGAPKPNESANGIVPAYEEDWYAASQVLDWILTKRFILITTTTYTSIITNIPARIFSVQKAISPLVICRLALKVHQQKTK